MDGEDLVYCARGRSLAVSVANVCGSHWVHEPGAAAVLVREGGGGRTLGTGR
jgi:hypothetical protein